MRRSLALLSLFLLLPALLFAQTITGAVIDAGGNSLGDVIIQNIHQNQTLTTHSDGAFSLMAKPGELIEFRKMGYKTTRVRIVSSSVPFYRIILEPGVVELSEVEVSGHYTDYQRDSVRYHEMFAHQLNFPTVTGWRAIQSPFTAMSKSNKNMIKFQEEYEWFERIKYVDSRFNAKVIGNLTGLKGDSVQRYIQAYRPSYEYLRTLDEYAFFNYVKQTAEMWRRRQNLGRSRSRGGG
jgi:hypothetical protein